MSLPLTPDSSVPRAPVAIWKDQCYSLLVDEESNTLILGLPSVTDVNHDYLAFIGQTDGIQVGLGVIKNSGHLRTRLYVNLPQQSNVLKFTQHRHNMLIFTMYYLDSDHDTGTPVLLDSSPYISDGGAVSVLYCHSIGRPVEVLPLGEAVARELRGDGHRVGLDLSFLGSQQFSEAPDIPFPRAISWMSVEAISFAHFREVNFRVGMRPSQIRNNMLELTMVYGLCLLLVLMGIRSNWAAIRHAADTGRILNAQVLVGLSTSIGYPTAISTAANLINNYDPTNLPPATVRRMRELVETVVRIAHAVLGYRQRALDPNTDSYQGHLFMFTILQTLIFSLRHLPQRLRN
ncbi:hypothetical protein HK102_005388 [Quaeritorhiza haematococci]|nr:hypothetical protein HK102_005388 [Quaeritorhiza haematococci]